jgi:thiamine biosynthesis lipoprotein
MIRCKPLLGTFVEIMAADETYSSQALEEAFSAIEKVQALMNFYHPASELSQINTDGHLKEIRLHPWTAQVLRIAQEIHVQSQGVFNCGVGHRLVDVGLLPHTEGPVNDSFGGIEDLHFLEPTRVRSRLPLCLDLGGIAKGFAVDKAVQALQGYEIPFGSVNAGGDIRVFGDRYQDIHIRNPANPHELIQIGAMKAGAIATSSLYFAKRNAISTSFIVNPHNREHIEFSQSYSVLANECVYADALTKVVCISGNTRHPCLDYFSARAITIPNTLTA